MVQTAKPSPNYSISDETKGSSDPRLTTVILSCATRLANIRRIQNVLSDLHRASAPMHNATVALCLMHACADARGEAGGSRVGVRVTREIIRFTPIRNESA